MSPFLRTFLNISLLFPVIGSGTVFFRYVEGWSWVDSYFFTVVTLSTVGYGELVPATTLGRIGTTIFIFTGLGVFAYVVQQVAALANRRHHAHMEWLEAHLGKTEEPDPPAANSPDVPHDIAHHSPKDRPHDTT